MDYETIVFTVEDAVATIRLNRPDTAGAEDGREGVSAFLANRRPEFLGG